MKKLDESWERYFGGQYPHLVERYDLMASLCVPPSVLDIGCGQGLLGALLYAMHPGQFTQSIGIDNDIRIIARGQELHDRLGSDVKLLCRRAESLDFDDAVFKTVVVCQVLEHVEDTGPVVSEALRVLKPGGRLIASVPVELTLSLAHRRVFSDAEEMMELFGDGIDWRGVKTLHRWYLAWGDKG